MSWEAQKPEDGNRGEKAENRGGGDKALRRKAFQERRVIRNHQPGGKYQSQADAYVDTGADRRVAEDMEPSIAGQMRTYQHAVLGSQETSNRVTRFYGDGCVMSTATGAQGGLSFPARSTAVTVYQKRWPGSTEVSRTAGVGNKSGVTSWPLVPSCSLL